MTEFQLRPVRVYVLPFSEDVSSFNPERVILKFLPSGTIDIGALCYLRRCSEERRHQPDRGKRVDLSSLDSVRVQRVRAIIQCISERVQYGSGTPRTEYAKTLSIVAFVDWADGAGHHFSCYDEYSARSAYRAFVDYLWERIRRNEIRSCTAAKSSKYVLEFLTDLLGVDDLHRGLNLPRVKNSETQHTIPPSEVTQAKALSLCNAVFDGLTNLVLEEMPYPHRIEMPKYLGWAPSILWIFPLHQWFKTPSELASESDMTRYGLGYDYVEGRAYELSEILPSFASRKEARNCKQRTTRNITASNKDPRCKSRISAAMQAHNTFAIQFLANTGMNMAQMISLEWSGDYKVSTVRQKFKVVKWRAQGKWQSFEIQSVFLPAFKRFLELRKYLLNKSPCRWLFISLGVGHNETPQQMKASVVQYMYRNLRCIDPALPSITSRDWRAANVDWMLRKKIPISVAADVAQNTEEVIKDAYATGSPETHKAEMTVFFEKVSSVVLNETQVAKGGQEGPLGLCMDYGHPDAAVRISKAVPDCKNPEGCLFCNKYKVHADEHDTRKLISSRYCIQRTAPLALSLEHFEEVFGTVLSRINQLLTEIRKRAIDPAMVDRIEKSVEEMGELDDYWAAKLELLIGLDLISI